MVDKKNDLKHIGWVGGSKKEILALDDVARKELGFQLYKLQKGKDPDDFKPMPSVGKGVYEIRTRDENNKNKVRCFYVTKIEGAIFVLYVFVKQTKKTGIADIEMGKKRYQLLKRELRGEL